jgi:general secretion pathway protein H
LRRGATAGFTLIELLIAIAIIAVLAAAAAPALNAVTGANARAAAGQLAGSLRWLFDTAALRHETCRMVLDFDERAFWPQCSARSRGGGLGGAGPAGGSPAGPGAPPDSPGDEELRELFPEVRSAEKRRLLAESGFGSFQDLSPKAHQLPGDATFGEIWTQHRREPVTSGRAYVYFYPQGQAERAQVPIVDGKNVYTVVLHPFTGHARVVNGKVEVRE